MNTQEPDRPADPGRRVTVRGVLGYLALVLGAVVVAAVSYGLLVVFSV